MGIIVSSVCRVLMGVALMLGVTGKLALADTPVIPFERYFADARGGGQTLKFNDFSGEIGANRIKALLRSGSTLGDRVLLQNGIAVYFPEGYIVSSSMTLNKFRPKGGLQDKAVRSKSDLEPDPNYHLSAQFDRLLGPVCAEVDGPLPGTKLRARRTARGVFSVIRVGPGQFDALSGERSVGYRIVSAVDTPFLGRDPTVAILIDQCTQS